VSVAILKFINERTVRLPDATHNDATENNTVS